MINRRKALASVAIVAAASTLAATTLPAQASPGGASPQLKVIKTISSAYVAPLQFAVGRHKILVADNAASALFKVGDPTPLATNPGDGHEIAGVAIDNRSGAIAYTTATSTEEGEHTAAALIVKRRGRPDKVTDLFKFETTHNPDQVNTYGVVGTPSQCVVDALTAAGIPVTYTGQLDTHPYGVVSLGRGAWAVADAGGNDILRVDRNGHVSVLAVLPPQPVVITAAFAASQGLPSCVAGITYTFEPVPTDVEVGPHGKLYVTTLPGGGGGLGSVYKLASSHHYGRATQVATGFNEATNLAIDNCGRIFVAELGSGDIAEVVHGKPVPVISLPDVVAVEYANGHLYASTSPAAATEDGPPPAPGSPPPAPGQILLLGR